MSSFECIMITNSQNQRDQRNGHISSCCLEIKIQKHFNYAGCGRHQLADWIILLDNDG